MNLIKKINNFFRLIIDSNYVKFFIFIVFLIILTCFLSLSFSYEWNRYAKKSYLNYQTLSQFISGFGAIFAVLIAIFINRINKYFEQTDLKIILNNEYDKNFEFNNYKVRYFIHLKLLNINPETPLNNCSVYLKPTNFGRLITDIPRAFPFSILRQTEKNIFIEDFIDLCYIDLEFGNVIIAELKLKVLNYKEINLDLFKRESIELNLYAQSSSLDSIKNYKLNFKIKNEEVHKFLNNCKSIREEYIKKNNGADNIENLVDQFNFQKFYDLLELKIEEE